ncbi:MAG: ferredoxin family protein [Candidatus Bathyarchaeota archaeon]|nr:ferredoxin family protein [Candidatus Bathyarchaeota archaeon]
MSEEMYEDVPRRKIPWYPTIDYSKCVGCGACVDYCTAGGFGVYVFEERDGKKLPVVKNPYNCIVFCRGCEDKEVCPVGAITHPSEEETHKIIEKLQKSKKRKT